MFDINYIFAQALQQAVAQALAPLAARVTGLETSLTALENNPAIGVDTTLAAEQRTLAARVTALEENKLPAFSTLIDKNDLLAHLDQQEWFWEKVSRFVADNSVFDANDLKTLKDRIEALEDAKEERKGVTAERVEEMITAAIDDHCSTYNHDEYDDAVSTINDYDFDDFLTKDELSSELRDQINDTLNNASISISV